jgi:hypothetical protein
LSTCCLMDPVPRRMLPLRGQSESNSCFIAFDLAHATTIHDIQDP